MQLLIRTHVENQILVPLKLVCHCYHFAHFVPYLTTVLRALIIEGLTARIENEHVRSSLTCMTAPALSNWPQ